MKQTIKAFLLTGALAISAITTQAISFKGSTFTFKGDVKEWSEPLEATLSAEMKKGDGKVDVPVRVRVRVVRKIFRGCRYEVEVTNLDKKYRLSYIAEGLNQKPKSHKLKPGETEVWGSDTFLSKNCPDVDGCGNGTCPYEIELVEAEAKE
jgi:hypothetical protein